MLGVLVFLTGSVYKRLVKNVILLHLTFTVFKRISPIEIRLVRPVLETAADVLTDARTINTFHNEERQLKEQSQRREKGASVEKLEQNNMHYSLFHKPAQNKHAALASGAAASF